MKFKIKLKLDMVQAIEQLIAEYLQYEFVDIDDKLIMAALAEVRLTMQKRLLETRAEYAFSFSPVQAIALSIWFTDYIGDHTTQVGNKLHTISSQVQKQFA